MYITKQIDKFKTEVVKAVDLIFLIFKALSSLDIVVDIMKIPIRGINNKNKSKI